MIRLDSIGKQHGRQILFMEASAAINRGEKVGLVGRNGAGKSSLFALLAGRLSPDAGDYEIPPRWRLGEVAQNMPETEDPATDFVLDGDLPLLESRQRLAAAEASDDGHAIAEAHMAYEEAGGFDARARALGFSPQTQTLEVHGLCAQCAGRPA